MQTIVDAFDCAASKQHTSRARGLLFSLPIPYCLSPGKLHPLLEGADTRNGNRKKIFFWDTYNTYESDTKNEKGFPRNWLVFLRFRVSKYDIILIDLKDQYCQCCCFSISKPHKHVPFQTLNPKNVNLWDMSTNKVRPAK